jgi:trehalose-phosphatase
VIYAGSHGLDIEGPDLRFVHPEAEAQREGLVAIGVTLSLRAANVPGLRVEAKRFGVALHYRHVATDQRRQVEMELARAIQQEGGRLRVFHGTKVLEIQPQAPWGKRECALWIESAVRGASSAPLMVVYMGDDWTDEIVFEALSGQAMTIRVGDGAPASRASYLLPDVADAQRLLGRLAALTRPRG